MSDVSSISESSTSDTSSNSEASFSNASSDSQGVRYIAEVAPSRTGKHPVLSYRVPGTDTSYTFTFKRNSSHHDLYQCQQCKSRGKWTGVKVVDKEFLYDPTLLDHHPECRPLKTAHNLVERAVYQFYHNVKADPSFAGKKPKPLWHQQARIIKEKAAAEDESLGLEMIHHHHKKGHVSRRDAIRRAVQVHDYQEAQATMESIPDHLRFLWDGSLFVHRLEPTLHVYYNRNTIQMAARNGLHALVADGVHSFQPRQLQREGQLYTVHGVCRNGVEVPLLYAISSKKTQQLNTLIEGDHPLLTKLIHVLHDLDGEAQSALITLQQNPSFTKYLRRRDRERRERIAYEMRSFSDNYHDGVLRSDIEEYCRTMSRFVADSTI